MKTDEFNFDLPRHLIAQYPPQTRGQSRLMTLDRVTGKRAHTTVLQLPDILCAECFLSPDSEAPLLVFNDTKVRKARVYAKSETGANEEFLFLEEKGPLLWKTLVKRARRKKIGSVYVFSDNEGELTAKAHVAGFEKDYVLLEFEEKLTDDWFEKCGSVPLPPYIKRKTFDLQDSERYQTVYAKETGSAACPTAGLHFTSGLLDALGARGIGKVFITLRVGLGTFLPVRAPDIEDHIMHEESFFISNESAALIEDAMARKRKIIAVGTTSLRALESSFSGGSLKRGSQSTSIFIYPGYKFKTADALFTNFHTPLSTLLMLACAFAGKDLLLESYAEAVREEYRFFSYGDAMLIY